MPRSIRSDVLPPGHVKVIAAIYDLYRERKPISIRTVAKRCGFKASNHVHHIVRKLRRLGVISFEDREVATIQPVLQLIVCKPEAMRTA
jgi:predicted transcriptional regulator